MQQLGVSFFSFKHSAANEHFVTLNRTFSEIYTDDPVPRPNPDGDEISPTPIKRKVYHICNALSSEKAGTRSSENIYSMVGWVSGL